MRSLFEHYGHAILTCLGVILIFGILFFKADFGGHEQSVLGFMATNEKEWIEDENPGDANGMDDYMRRKKPTIELLYHYRLFEKTPIDVQGLFYSEDADGNELSEEVMWVKDSHNNNLGTLLDDDGYIVFPTEDQYTITVRAIDRMGAETMVSYKLAVDIVAEYESLPRINFTDYFYNHYLRVASHDKSKFITYTDGISYDSYEPSSDWVLDERKMARGILGYYTYPEYKLYEDYKFSKMTGANIEIINDEEVIKIEQDTEVNMFYEPKMCTVIFRTNLGEEETVKMMSGTQFKINKIKEEGYYLPVITVNNNNYDNEIIDITTDMLDKVIYVDLQYDKAPSIDDYKGVYDGKSHTVSLHLGENDTIIYGRLSTSLADIFTGNMYIYDQETIPTRTNAGTTLVPYKITNPNHEDIIGLAKIDIDKAKGWISISASKGNTCTGLTQYFSVTSNSGSSYTISRSNSYAAATASGNGVTIRPSSTGTTIFTVTSSGNSNYTDATATYTATFTKHTEYCYSSTTGANCITSGYNYYKCSQCNTNTGSVANGKYGPHNCAYNANDWSWENRLDCDLDGNCTNDIYAYMYGYTHFLYCGRCGASANICCRHTPGAIVDYDYQYGYAIPIYECSKCGVLCWDHWTDTTSHWDRSWTWWVNSGQAYCQ